MFSIGWNEMLLLGIVAVVLFGKKLPEVARSLGGSYREFRKGLTDFQQSFTEATNEVTAPIKSVGSSVKSTKSYDDFDDYDQPSAPKFTLPSKPAESDSSSTAQ